MTHKELALPPVITSIQRRAIGGRSLGCATEPSQQISPNRVSQMISRQINSIDQLQRRLNTVYLRNHYSPIQCNNRIRSNGHELIVELQYLPPICALN